VAVGIGANTSVFGLLHSVLIRPLPFPDSNRLLVVDATAPERGVDDMGFSYAELLDWQEMNREFDALAGFYYADLTVSGGDSPLRLKGTLVSANFLEVLSVRPMLGRGFLPREESLHADRSILIGEGLWRSRFGSDPNIVGSSVTVGGESSTIVGVLPAQVTFPEASQIWMPFRWDPENPRYMREARMIGRLRPGATTDQALTDLQRIAALLAERHPDTNAGVGVRVRLLREVVFGNDGERILILYVVASLVLLLACANVASLLLVRNDSRRHELAIRSSLGAGRGQIVRLLLTESLLMAVLGGVLGIALGWYGRDFLLAIRPRELQPLFFPEIRPDFLFVTVAIVTATGVLFGLLPSLTATGAGSSGLVRNTGGDGKSGSKLGLTLVSANVALALTVLVGASLMVKSAMRHGALHPGFDPDNVVTLQLHLPDADWTDRARRRTFFEEVLTEVRAMPEVESASVITELAAEPKSQRWRMRQEGTESYDPREVPLVLTDVCDKGYFETMGIPLLAGRDFAGADRRDDTPQVVIVNVALARRFWPGENPIGKRIGLGGGTPSSEDRWYRVVGLVGDTYNSGWGSPTEPQAFFPLGKITPYDSYFTVRTVGNAKAVLTAMRERIWSVNPDIPLSRIRTMEQVVRQSNWHVSFNSWAFSLFSVIALVLAATGVYAITAHTVARRWREFAIRIAVGACSRDVDRLVLGRGARALGSGVVLGLSVSLVGARFLGAMLFGVSPMDLGVYVTSLGVLTVVSLSAGLVPLIRLRRQSLMAVLGGE
jgi:predicted permease